MGFQWEALPACMVIHRLLSNSRLIGIQSPDQNYYDDAGLLRYTWLDGQGIGYNTHLNPPGLGLHGGANQLAALFPST